MILQSGGESSSASYIEKAIKSGHKAIEELLISNELWGGAGSIADQACIGNTASRKSLELKLIELAEQQQKIGYVNPRTESWLSAFRKWDA